MKKYIEGIRFGLVLQFIIGPMCLLVFHTSKNNGFFFTIPLILVIALVDAIYISLACIGISKVLENKKIRSVFTIIGSVILILFGINTILNVFNINILPVIQLRPNTNNIILQGFILALSNPITIMFWGSVLTTKIVSDNLGRKDLLLFCIGLVSATLLFQTIVALLGSLIGKFLPTELSKIINILIGVYIIYLGFKRLTDRSVK